MSKFRARLLAAAGIVTMSLAGLATPAFAHEERTVGNNLHFAVGWGNEPTYTDTKNSVQLFLNDAGNKPITDLGDTLQVEIMFGTQKTDPQKFEAAFGPGFGTPGEYDVAVTPTRSGVYTFHIFGTVHGQKVDEKFTSSDSTFDSPKAATEIEFPGKDPSNADLASKLDRTAKRLEAVNTSAAKATKKAKSDASTLAIVALVIGALGLIVGAVGLTRSRRTA